MNFREATDTFLSPRSIGTLARKMGVSEATIRQARLSEEAKAHRPPPAGWEEHLAVLAMEEAARLRGVATAVRPDLVESFDVLDSLPRMNPLHPEPKSRGVPVFLSDNSELPPAVVPTPAGWQPRPVLPGGTGPQARRPYSKERQTGTRRKP